MNRSLLAALLLLPALPASARAETQEVPVHVIRAVDRRLPALDDEDLKDVFEETNRTLRTKLGTEARFSFRDHGKVTLENFFAAEEYRTPAFEDYAASNRYALDGPPPDFRKDREFILMFLRQWKLADLGGFFPDAEVRSYEELFDRLTATYVQKVERLKGIRLFDGSPLLDPAGAPHQSYIHWEALMHAQDRYDLVITNGLIVYDKYKRPYPHTVCKHAKVGGGAFESPRREVFDGHSMVVNVLEDYGAVPEFSGDLQGLPRAKRNKILAGFLFAHEFGHAFFYIPDVYDHGDSCLMNSSFENLSHRQGYELLMKDRKACLKCRPYVLAKEEALRAAASAQAGQHLAAGDHYVKAAELTPDWLDTDKDSYLMRLYVRAADAYAAAGDSRKETRTRNLINALKRRIEREAAAP